jgi:hypothetical protein
MSISNRHTVVPFVSGETQAMAGQRLLKIGYKGRAQKDGTTKKARFNSVAASVPQIDPAQIQEHMQRLIPHIGTMLENVQDSVARSLYESSGGLLGELGDDDISIPACLNFLEAEANGSRLTAERIKEWFVSELQDNLSVWSAEKFGFTDPNAAQMETVNQQVNAYCAVFASLSGKNLSMEKSKIAKLRNALSLCADDGSEIAQKISTRLTALETPTPVIDYAEML